MSPDAHVCTAITKTATLDWVADAKRCARTVKPDVTVMFIGANGAFDIPGRAARCYVLLGPGANG